MQTPHSRSSLFVVDSAYQVLNAVEATHQLSLCECHLLVLKREGPAREALRQVIALHPWATVRFLTPEIDTTAFKLRILGSTVGGWVQSVAARCLHFRRMGQVSKVIGSLPPVENVFLGHYWPGSKDLMRHFANRVPHRALYLLDDGTDIIDINDLRVRWDGGTGSGASTNRGSLGARLRQHWNFDVSEANSIAFFTTYALAVRPGDRLIKNGYGFLRSRAKATVFTDEVYLLGQCLVDDGYVEADTYLELLLAISRLFPAKKIVYVTHPRETADILERIRRIVGFETRSFKFPIEYELAVTGPIPRDLVSFFCSALESCHHIFGDQIDVIGVYIPPDRLLRMKEVVEKIYGYFSQRQDAHFRVVRLVESAAARAVE